MKTLDLATYGVEEMNQQEMQDTNGGIAPFLMLAFAAAIVGIVYLCGGGGNTSVRVG